MQKNNCFLTLYIDLELARSLTNESHFSSYFDFVISS